MSTLKNLFNLGLGTLITTKEKAEEVVDELIKKGEVGQEEGKELVDELIKKGEKTKKELEKQIKKITEEVLEKVNIGTRKEIEELKAEIKQLKKKIAQK